MNGQRIALWYLVENQQGSWYLNSSNKPPQINSILEDVGNMDLIWRYIEEFQDRTQGPEETVEDYVVDKRRLAQKAQQPEDFVMASTIHGFHPHIRADIMRQSQSPRTLDEAIRMAHKVSRIPRVAAGLSQETVPQIKDIVSRAESAVLFLQQTASFSHELLRQNVSNRDSMHIHNVIQDKRRGQYACLQQYAIYTQQRKQHFTLVPTQHVSKIAISC